ncbi:hypothetical protein C8Q78DRAFT_279852 [Trametes maxima]|nr:hypothetical protein C8Q78DRAFT_279852 [Trametes maxima]
MLMSHAASNAILSVSAAPCNALFEWSSSAAETCLLRMPWRTNGNVSCLATETAKQRLSRCRPSMSVLCCEHKIPEYTNPHTTFPDATMPSHYSWMTLYSKSCARRSFG